MANSLSRKQLKKLILEVVLSETLKGMTRRDLENMDKVRKSSTNRRNFLKKASMAGLGVAALAYLYRLGGSKPNTSQDTPQNTEKTNQDAEGDRQEELENQQEKTDEYIKNNLIMTDKTWSRWHTEMIATTKFYLINKSEFPLVSVGFAVFFQTGEHQLVDNDTQLFNLETPIQPGKGQWFNLRWKCKYDPRIYKFSTTRIHWASNRPSPRGEKY